ncbi:Protein G12 [Trachymyrmex zeteki]|uniref:Protein G12 n=2 Tax=Mycetomoellerius zeteki TaxID=64791 RepID=A0A151XFW9_9HYME|nr:Protein G12 [Trachymyrmex zeteki]
MKYISALFAALTIIGLGQAHQFPDFGEGALHEDIQDILDLVPYQEIRSIVLDYISGDSEVQEVFNFFLNSTLLKNLMLDLEAIPEVINILNYMQKEGVDIYSLVNKANKALGIDEIAPPPSRLYSLVIQRTGGIVGLVKDITDVIPTAKIIRIYVQKMKTSSAFVGFVNQLKSDNAQQVVNKAYQIKSLQTILNGLKIRGVNTQISADIMFIVLGLNVPNDVTVYQERTLEDDLMDFVNSLPIDQFIKLALKYIVEDEKVQHSLQYLQTPEFHSSLCDLEALKEYQALVVYLEKAGLNVTDYIKTFHKAIGMEDYVPPKIESIFKSKIGIQKIGDGIKGLLEDLYNLIPFDKIEALYNEKLQNSKVFADFIGKLKSPEMQKLINDLCVNQTFKNFVTKAKENGWELTGLKKFSARIFGFKFPHIKIYNVIF